LVSYSATRSNSHIVKISSDKDSVRLHV
jgi:hypothetical protein